RHVEKHLYGCFAALGIPLALKTDNGLAYKSLRFKCFCNTWGVPHNPTGQAIIERAHQT
ncbi:POK7 protein, partial [Atrichornis clamosus]|nr:POK7 protein [Atrichornis clamosus]